MDKKIRRIVSLLVSILMVMLTIIAINHVENYKGVKEAEYIKKVDNAITNALSEISKYELKEHVKDSLKFQYWTQFREVKDKDLRFYPISDNGKWKLARQVTIKQFPELNRKSKIRDENSFYFDNYIPTFIAGRYIIEEMMDDIYLREFFDSMQFHLKNPPIYKNYELDTIYNIVEKHLRMSNILTDFEYCIYVPTFNKFVICENLDEIEVLTKGKLYNYETYNENTVIPALFTVQFLDKTDYLTSYDKFVIIFTWAEMFLVYLLFIYLLSTDIRISKISELRDNFINNITHEFKTPISSIALATESLLDDDVLNNKEVREKCINAIREENERLERMVDTILQTASMDQKSFLLRQKKNNEDVHYCIEPAIKEILLLLHKKEGTITIDYCAKNSIAFIDKTQIILTIKNILDNAVKYTLDVPPRIEMKTSNKGKYLLISIKDNGIGMNKKQQRKIFNKLYRSNTGNIHNVKGYGLGLYNVKAIIKSHKGKIKVDSELNKGSIFTIYLPTRQI